MSHTKQRQLRSADGALARATACSVSGLVCEDAARAFHACLAIIRLLNVERASGHADYMEHGPPCSSQLRAGCERCVQLITTACR